MIEESKEESIWTDGEFIEPINPKDVKEKIKTLDKEYAKNLNFKCRICGKGINAHHKDWHDRMCDDCFNKTYFKEKEK